MSNKTALLLILDQEKINMKEKKKQAKYVFLGKEISLLVWSEERSRPKEPTSWRCLIPLAHFPKSVLAISTSEHKTMLKNTH